MSKKVSFMGAAQPTGYGIASMGITRGLHETGNDVQFFDISHADVTGQKYYNTETDKRIIEALQMKTNKFHYDAPCVRMWHQFAMETWVGKGKKIGWPIFELDKFNEIEKHHLSFPDELVVCSEWAADVIKTEMGRNAHVVPLGVDPSLFYPGSVERDTSKTFTFLNIGKWEVRKGHDVLADIYNMAFRKDDKVRLQVLAPLWASQAERRDWVEYYKNTDMGSTIEFLERQPTHADIARIMREADAGVFPARAEGWNLELLEMMAVGKPVIALDYGAHRQYCDIDNCYLIGVDELELAYDGKWFYGQGSWAAIGDIQKKDMADAMRFVYENWKFNDAGVATGKQFSWANAAKKLAEIL